MCPFAAKSSTRPSSEGRIPLIPQATRQKPPAHNSINRNAPGSCPARQDKKHLQRKSSISADTPHVPRARRVPVTRDEPNQRAAGNGNPAITHVTLGGTALALFEIDALRDRRFGRCNPCFPEHERMAVGFREAFNLLPALRKAGANRMQGSGANGGIATLTRDVEQQ